MQWTTKKGKRGKEENVRGKNKNFQHAKQKMKTNDFRDIYN